MGIEAHPLKRYLSSNHHTKPLKEVLPNHGEPQLRLWPAAEEDPTKTVGSVRYRRSQLNIAVETTTHRGFQASADFESWAITR